ncbi:helix-turn-helix domain-containing protein [Micromonospora sp. NPDC047465]|uniref:RICIN domain-containing protein n=1 Tax=Micromonospora sp. NPDC047465 TaxID=3154813 RepID=UPI0033E90C59
MSVGATGDERPDEAATVAELVALMARLKQRSGCTYRQLEQRATAGGEALPRSTIADVLRRPTLPRAEVLAAFVRACGGDQEEVDVWLRARDRLGAATEPAAPPPAPPPDAPDPGDAPPVRRRWPWLRPAVALLAAAGLAIPLAVWATEQRDQPDRQPERPVVSGSLDLPEEGAWAQIHPVGSPTLCLSEGRERTGRYQGSVATLQPCDKPDLPRTRLEPVRDNLVHIQWDHPQFGIGCLTVLKSPPAQDMLEPWTDCSPSRKEQLFAAERVDTPVPGGYRLRPAASGLCIGIRDDARTPIGAEAMQGPCTGKAHQEFLIDLTPAS